MKKGRREALFYSGPKWGLTWTSEDSQNPMFADCKPLIFQRRSEARAYAAENFGYIKKRKDLRTAPHWWRMPRPIKILGLIYEAARVDGGRMT